MTNKTFEHRGYFGSIEADAESEVLFGKLLFVNDLVTYEGENVVALKEAFVEAVEDYLETCSELGVNPERPMKGVFNVRIAPELHREAAVRAATMGVSLNDYVRQSIQMRVDECKEVRHTHVHRFETTYGQGMYTSVATDDIYGDSSVGVSTKVTEQQLQ